MDPNAQILSEFANPGNGCHAPALPPANLAAILAADASPLVSVTAIGAGILDLIPESGAGHGVCFASDREAEAIAARLQPLLAGLSLLDLGGCPVLLFTGPAGVLPGASPLAAVEVEPGAVELRAESGETATILLRPAEAARVGATLQALLPRLALSALGLVLAANGTP